MRPTATVGAHSQEFTAAGSSTDKSTDLERLAARHDYAVRVVAERADGVLVTQFYSNLPAAERKVTRTRDRGLRADMHLVRVVPVGVVPLPLVATVDDLVRLVDEGVLA